MKCAVCSKNIGLTDTRVMRWPVFDEIGCVGVLNEKLCIDCDDWWDENFYPIYDYALHGRTERGAICNG